MTVTVIITQKCAARMIVRLTLVVLLRLYVKVLREVQIIHKVLNLVNSMLDHQIIQFRRCLIF